jgi:hypothetical protein
VDAVGAQRAADGSRRRSRCLRGFRGQFDKDEDFIYAIFDREESRVLGGTGLHTRIGEHAREIGYWIRADAEGNGYVTEAVAALTRVGFELEGLDRIEIRVEPENVRSRRIPEPPRLRGGGDPPGAHPQRAERAARCHRLLALQRPRIPSHPRRKPSSRRSNAAGGKLL